MNKNSCVCLYFLKHSVASQLPQRELESFWLIVEGALRKPYQEDWPPSRVDEVKIAMPILASGCYVLQMKSVLCFAHESRNNTFTLPRTRYSAIFASATVWRFRRTTEGLFAHASLRCTPMKFHRCWSCTSSCHCSNKPNGTMQ